MTTLKLSNQEMDTLTDALKIVSFQLKDEKTLALLNKIMFGEEFMESEDKGALKEI